MLRYKVLRLIQNRNYISRLSLLVLLNIIKETDFLNFLT